MIGNDIVDLSVARRSSDWRRPRYLDKIFTEYEKEMIARSTDPTMTVWQLWSAKEAAYKLYVQKNGGRFYDPRGFQCSCSEDGLSVTFKGTQCSIIGESTVDYILSEATYEPRALRSRLVRFASVESTDQSKVLRHRLLSALTQTYGVAESDLYFVKLGNGVPIVQLESQFIHLSLTHHGRYGAFAF